MSGQYEVGDREQVAERRKLENALARRDQAERDACDAERHDVRDAPPLAETDRQARPGIR